MNEKDIQKIPHIGIRLRAARRRQKLSLRELAEKAQVSASLLSKVENGKANPSVRTLYSIADAMSLSPNYFFPNEDISDIKNDAENKEVKNVRDASATQFQPAQAAALLGNADVGFVNTTDQPSEGPIVRASARPTIELLGGITWSRLTPRTETGIEFMEICYAAGTNSGEQMSYHTGREFQLVLEGELLLELGFEQYLLKPGDSIIYDSTTPHRLSNAGQGPMRAISVIFNT